ncbi:hypothetical protein [Thiocapsa imhoffii]|uniref:hypothetical protein n=1 Tax=Thiocapsa imhoffii TaxID=382777 RepID=UPI00190541F6|nr:hypothetical protein [Thiocapsa imhoffii]
MRSNVSRVVCFDVGVRASSVGSVPIARAQGIDRIGTQAGGLGDLPVGGHAALDEAAGG